MVRRDDDYSYLLDRLERDMDLDEVDLDTLVTYLMKGNKKDSAFNERLAKRIFSEHTIRKEDDIVKRRRSIDGRNKFEVSGYENVKPYKRGYERWNQTEISFLKTQREKKIKPKEFIAEYRKVFSSHRSDKAVLSKYYRS